MTPLRLSGVPPPMAHNELTLDSNAVDVAFSKSGTRIAVLMNDHFSVFLWSLKSRPVPVPILESSYPLSYENDSRPRQIAFINDNEVYILRSRGPNNTCIERTALETRGTKVAYETADSEQVFSIFANLGQETLWFSHSRQPGQPIAYSHITMPSSDGFQITPWTESPPVDTYWAKTVQVSDDEVKHHNDAFMCIANNPKAILISLSRTGGLYANKTLLAKNCTSFLVTSSHVIFTTSLHLLKFVHLDKAEG